ncbi:ParB/RepB/Spo0J family partition protein [Marivivens aquimaris]|uniref:ParB/RepB/Spo0J family partition protein n=1 Tax=Marivivens aquimaris TaxID=2774876 RepID=UPI00187EFA60|nr:ParB/RepB/Spo0J family partition protein [Marivivens aquimaris]
MNAIVQTPLGRLTLSPINPRQTAAEDGIATLAASIKVCGLIQSLGGYKPADAAEDEPVQIVAGGRRLRALQSLVESGDYTDAILVPVMITDDEATARQWSIAENEIREGVDLAHQVRAYQRQYELTPNIEAIAEAFGVSKRKVKQRLKLADLGDMALTAWAEGKIDDETAGALTLCEAGERQDELVTGLLNKDFNGWELRRKITNQSIDGTERIGKLVLEQYRARGGAETADLFSDEIWLHDTELAFDIAKEILVAKADELLAEGWASVEVASLEVSSRWQLQDGTIFVRGDTSPLTEEEQDELASLKAAVAENDGPISDEIREMTNQIWKLENKPPAYSDELKSQTNATIYIGYKGVELYPWVAPKGGGETISQSSAATQEQAAGPVYSQAVVNDLRAVRLAAMQHALMKNPNLGLELLALLIGGDTYGAAVTINSQTNTPSTKDDGWVQPDIKRSLDSASHRLKDKVAAFTENNTQERHIELLLSALLPALQYALCHTLGETEERQKLWNLYGRQAGMNLREFWTPTDTNFFKRITADQLHGIWSELVGCKPGEPKQLAFESQKKGAKVKQLHALFHDEATRKNLTKAQLKRVEAWEPEIV